MILISEVVSLARCLAAVPKKWSTGTQDGWGREMLVEILLVTGQSTWTRKPSTAGGVIRKESTVMGGKAA